MYFISLRALLLSFALLLGATKLQAAKPIQTGFIDLIPGQESNGGPSAYHTGTGKLYIATTQQFGGAIHVVDPVSRLVTSVIQVPDVGGFWDIAVDSTNHRLYATSGDKLCIVNTATEQLLGSVSFGQEVYNVTRLAFDPGLQRVFATDHTSDKVYVINPLNQQLIATWPVPIKPWGISVNPVTHRVYVGCGGDSEGAGRRVAVLDGSATAATQIAEIPLDTNAGARFSSANPELAFHPGVNKVYATITAGGDSINVIDATTHTLSKTISYSTPDRIALDPSRNQLFLVRSGTVIDVYQTIDDTLLRTIPAIDESRQDRRIEGIAVNTATGDLCRSTRDSAAVFRGGERLGVVPIHVTPTALAVNSPAGKFYYGTSDGMLLVVDRATGKVERAVLLPGSVSDIAYNAQTNRIYTVSHASGDISVIDASDYRVLASRPVYYLQERRLNGDGSITEVHAVDGPHRLAIDTARNRVYVLQQKLVSIVPGDFETSTDPVFASLHDLGTECSAFVYDSVRDRLYIAARFMRTTPGGSSISSPGITVRPVVGESYERFIEEPLTSPGQPHYSSYFYEHLALNETTGLLYAAGVDPATDNAQLKVIDVKAGSATRYNIIARIASPATGSSTRFGDLAVNEAANRIYALAGTSWDTVKLGVIDGETNTWDGPPADYPFAYNTPLLTAFDPATSSIYISHVRPFRYENGTRLTEVAGLEIIYDGPDTTPPAVTITEPASGGNHPALLLRFGRITTSDVRSEIATAQVSLFRAATGSTPAAYWNGTQWVESTAEIFFNAAQGEDGIWTFPVPTRAEGLVRGAYVLRTRVTDAAGNSTDSTSQFNITAPGAFNLNAAEYSVAENAGSITITVKRTGGADGAASVVYNILDDTARWFESAHPFGVLYGDYVEPPPVEERRLNFADGETTKTFTVSIRDDNFIEGPQTIRLQLSQPSAGAELGTTAAAVLTIQDTTPASRLSLAGSIDLLPGPDTAAPFLVAANTLTNRLYASGVSNRNNGTLSESPQGRVSVINAATASVITGINIPGRIFTSAVDQSTNRIYVLTQTGPYRGTFNELHVIDGTTNEVITSVAVPNNDGGGWMAIDQSRQKVYLLGRFNDGKLSVFNATTLAFEGGITVPGLSSDSPYAHLAYDETHHQAFIRINSSVLALDVLSGAATTISGIPAALHTINAVVNSTTGTLFLIGSVPGGTSQQLVAIRTSDRSLISSTPLGFYAESLNINTATNQLYVGDGSYPEPTRVYDGTSLAQTGTLPTREKTICAVPALGRLAYTVGEKNSVALLDPATGKVEHVVTAYKPAQVISVSRNGLHKIYVADAEAPGVVVLDGNSQTVIARLPVSATSLAYNAAAGKVFAAMSSQEDGATLRAIDVASDTVDPEELTLSSHSQYGAVPLASDPAGKLYAFVRQPAEGDDPLLTSTIKLLEIDVTPGSTAYGTIVRAVDTGGQAAHNAVFDSSRDRVYATVGTTAGRFIKIYPQTTLTEGGSISLAGAPMGDDSLTGFVLDEATHRLYRTGSTYNAIDIFDVQPGSATENQLLSSVYASHIYNSFGYGLTSIAIDSTTQRLFFGDGGGDEGAVGVIDANTQQVTDTLCDIGLYPVSVALAFNTTTQRLYASNAYDGMVWVFQNGAPDLPTLPHPDHFAVKTTTPEMNGVPWTFEVTASANTAVVKFQARKQGETEWTDLSGKVSQNGNVWKLTTSVVPTGNVVFRALATAPNFAPSSIESQPVFVAVNSNLPKVPAGKTFAAIPQSPGFPWTFTFTQPAKTPGLQVYIQGSVDGETWVDLPNGVMSRASGAAGIWTLTTADVPTNLRHFRAVSSADGFSDSNSAVFSNVLPAFKGLKISTKKPALSGQKWLLSVGFSSKAPNVAVRFQSTLTPENEASWSDLPVYEPATRKGAKWAQVTYNVPAGLRYFRAVASAPGWADSVSTPSKPTEVTASSGLVLPPIVSLNLHPVGDALRSGEPILFTAVQDSAKGVTVRFQTKLTSEGDDKWTDLPAGGIQARVRKSWNLLTPLVPSGMRDFRVVASAPEYLDSISNVQSLEIKEPQAPQLPAAFSDFLFPAPTQRVFKTGEVINTRMSVSDPNGLQHVRLQFATTKQPFQDAGSGDMISSGEGVYRNHNLYFSSPGTYFLRVAAADNASPSVTSYSSYITVLVGAGGGTSGPSFGQFTTSVTQPTARSKGSVFVSIPIGDDKQVYQAFLVRTDSSGVVQGYVGEMVQATTGNTAVRSLTDGNLNDGTYYYRVVASDFDGRITASPVVGPFTLSTPAPPPPQPVTINIAPESRLVNPTFPVTSTGKRVIYNHKDMPLPDHGTVRFSYSGLPAGTNQIVVFKTALGESRPFYTKTVTNTSGELTIAAPKFEGEDQGEGEYELRVFRGGRAFPVTTGSVNKFTVGHSWNQPDTFTRLDYGLYWFKDVSNGLKARGAGQNDEYFDPNKPTIIYVHGWQFGEVGNKRRESWDRIDPVTKGRRDTCKIWKDLGYNVGIFYWNQFAWEPGTGLYKSEAKIYGSTGEKGDLPAGQGMTYALYDASAAEKMSIWINPDEIGNTSIADLFYNEVVRSLAGYQTSSSKELRVVGHSLGTQVTGRAMWLLEQRKPAGVPLPTRVALLDLAQTNTTTLPANPGSTVPQLQKSYVGKLAAAGVAVESYQSTDLQSFFGLIGVDAKPVYDATAYARIRPDWIPPGGVADSHSEAVRWYSESMRYEELPTYSYWAPFAIRDRIGKAISASTSTGRIRSLMGGQLYFEQSEGKNSSGVADDGFEERTNRN